MVLDFSGLGCGMGIPFFFLDWASLYKNDPGNRNGAFPCTYFCSSD